jgi:acyl-CoA thioesterase
MGCDATVTTEMLVEGGRVTQARAIMHAEGREVLTVSGALGTGDIQQPAPWVRPIAVPPPEECPPRPWRSLGVNSVFDHVETRVAHGRHTLGEYDGNPGEPLTAYWLRHPSHLDPEAATLAIFGDFMAGSFSQPVGRILFGRSLDNTLRIASSEPTEWVLAEMHQHALVDGFGQGTMYLWSEKGTLLATASQSVSTIYYDGPPLGTLQKTE